MRTTDANGESEAQTAASRPSAGAAAFFSERFAAIPPRNFTLQSNDQLAMDVDAEGCTFRVTIVVETGEDVALVDGTPKTASFSLPYRAIDEQGGGNQGAYRGTARKQAIALSQVTFSRENFGDRRSKRWGLSRELQTGDAPFDDHVFIDTDADHRVLRQLLSDGALREALAAAVGELDKITVSGDGGRLHATVTETPIGPEKVRSAADLLAVVAAHLPPIKHLEQSRLRERVIAGTAGALTIAGCVAMGIGIDSYPTADAWFTRWPWTAFTVASALLALPLAWLFARGGSESWRRFRTFAGTFVFALPALVAGPVRFVNGAFDRSAQEISGLKIDNLVDTGGEDSSYSIRFVSWLDPRAIVDIQIKEETYHQFVDARANGVSTVIVRHRRGALGAAWVDGIKPGPRDE